MGDSKEFRMLRQPAKMFRISIALFLLILTNASFASPASKLDCAYLLALAEKEDVDFRALFLNNSLRLPPQEFAKQLVAMYPEFKWLTLKVHLSPEDARSTAHADAFSPELFQEFHPEIERTLTSLVVLQQILKGDYDGFTQSQTVPPIKLKPASFDYIRQLFFEILGREDRGPIALGGDAIDAIDLQKLDALITYMAIHDLGKSKRFENVASKVSGQVTVDHDQVLLQGLNSEPMLATSFEKLPQKYRELILQGMSADFNMGQFAQGENVAASLNGLSKLNRDSFNFYFAHLFLDVAGSSGVKTPHGSQVMIEPVFNGFRTGAEFLPKLYEGMNSDEVYRFFLQTRAANLGLNFSNDPKDYAIARLALMSRAASISDGAKVKNVFKSLEPEIRELLIHELNVTGNSTESAVLPYYSPALIANTRAAVKNAIQLQALDAPIHPLLDNGHPIVRLSETEYANMMQSLQAKVDSKALDAKKLPQRLKEFERAHNPEGIYVLNEPAIKKIIARKLTNRFGGEAANAELADTFALEQAFRILALSYQQARQLSLPSDIERIFTTNMNDLAAAAKSGLIFPEIALQRLGPREGSGANVQMIYVTPTPQ